jgi:hypothetical protein
VAKKAAKVEKELPLMWLCKTPAGTPANGSSGGFYLPCSATSTSSGELMIANVDSQDSQAPWSGAPTGFVLRTGDYNAGFDKLLTTSGTNTLPGTIYDALAANTISFCATFK